MILVVAHDAGGAEVLSSYIRQEKLDCIYVLEGPAKEIFRKKLGVNTCLSLSDAIYKASKVLCGTSWQSSLEFNAIKLAKLNGKQSIAFIDHWINYKDRFEMNGESLLPDEIWVGDEIAKSIASEVFPSVPISIKENPYFKDICKDLAEIDIKKLINLNETSILYVCEPISEHAKLQYGDKYHWGYIEEDALRYFLDNIALLSQSYNRILIRPHPSEIKNKYNWVFDEYKLPIKIGGSNSLLSEIMHSDIVVGCQSTAMVVGLLANKRVVSCIPPDGAPCGLPHQKIEHLRYMN